MNGSARDMFPAAARAGRVRCGVADDMPSCDTARSSAALRSVSDGLLETWLACSRSAPFCRDQIGRGGTEARADTAFLRAALCALGLRRRALPGGATQAVARQDRSLRSIAGRSAISASG